MLLRFAMLLKESKLSFLKSPNLLKVVLLLVLDLTPTLDSLKLSLKKFLVKLDMLSLLLLTNSKPFSAMMPLLNSLVLSTLLLLL